MADVINEMIENSNVAEQVLDSTSVETKSSVLGNVLKVGGAVLGVSVLAGAGMNLGMKIVDAAEDAIYIKKAKIAAAKAEKEKMKKKKEEEKKQESVVKSSEAANKVLNETK